MRESKDDPRDIQLVCDGGDGPATSVPRTCGCRVPVPGRRIGVPQNNAAGSAYNSISGLETTVSTSPPPSETNRADVAARRRRRTSSSPHLTVAAYCAPFAAILLLIVCGGGGGSWRTIGCGASEPPVGRRSFRVWNGNGNNSNASSSSSRFRPSSPKFSESVDGVGAAESQQRRTNAASVSAARNASLVAEDAIDCYHCRLDGPQSCCAQVSSAKVLRTVGPYNFHLYCTTIFRNVFKSEVVERGVLMSLDEKGEGCTLVPDGYYKCVCKTAHCNAVETPKAPCAALQPVDDGGGGGGGGGSRRLPSSRRYLTSSLSSSSSSSSQENKSKDDDKSLATDLHRRLRQQMSYSVHGSPASVVIRRPDDGRRGEVGTEGDVVSVESDGDHHRHSSNHRQPGGRVQEGSVFENGRVVLGATPTDPDRNLSAASAREQRRPPRIQNGGGRRRQPHVVVIPVDLDNSLTDRDISGRSSPLGPPRAVQSVEKLSPNDGHPAAAPDPPAAVSENNNNLGSDDVPASAVGDVDELSKDQYSSFSVQQEEQVRRQTPSSRRSSPWFSQTSTSSSSRRRNSGGGSCLKTSSTSNFSIFVLVIFLSIFEHLMFS